MALEYNNPHLQDHIPDVRDGLTRIERIILKVLRDTERELGGRHASTVMVYGRVCEYADISTDEFQRHLQRLTGKLNPPA